MTRLCFEVRLLLCPRHYRSHLRQYIQIQIEILMSFLPCDAPYLPIVESVVWHKIDLHLQHES